MRIYRSILSTSAISAIMAVSGCKKDEPAPVAPAPATDVAPVAEKTPERPADPKPATPEPTTPTPVAAADGALMRPAMDLTTVASLPEKVVGIGATKSLKALVETLAVFQPGLGEDPFGTILTMAQRGAGFGDLSKIAWEKPVYVVFPDPTSWNDGVAWMAHVLEGFDIKATFPGIVEADGMFKLDMNGQMLHMRVVDNMLQIASHADILTSLASFLKDTAASWTPSQLLQFEASVENAMKIYAEEITEMRAALPMMAKELEEGGVRGSQLDVLLKTANDGFALLEGVTRTGFALDPTGEYPRLAFNASFKPDTTGAKFAAQTKNRRAAFAVNVPDDAWLAFAGSWDPALSAEPAEEVAKTLSSFSDENFSWTPEEALVLANHIVKMNAATGDQQGFWLRAAGNMPLAFEGVSTVTDPAAWQTAMKAVIDHVLEKLWASAKANMGGAMGPGGEKLDGDLKTVWAQVTELVKPFGLALTTREDDKMTGMKLAVDWSKIPADGGPEMALVKTFLGNGFEVAFGTGATQAGMAFGPEGFARVEALSQPMTPGTDTWLKRAADRSWGALALRPAPLLKVLAAMPPFAQYREMMLSIPAAPIMVEGIAHEHMLQIEIEVPLAVVKAAGAIGAQLD